MLLSDHQFEEVESRISLSNIDNYQLKLDLLDHIACSIEELMEEGETFEQAANNIFATFSERHIKRIEYTTERLTMNNMKKHTKMLGILGFSIMIVGSLLSNIAWYRSDCDRIWIFWCQCH